MREVWRAVRLLVGTSVRTDPWRSAAALLELLRVLALPIMALGLKFLTDGVLQASASQVVLGVALVGVVLPAVGLISFIGIDMRIMLHERVGFAFDREVARLTSAIPGIEHHERADYQDRLELLRQNQSTLADSLMGILGLLTAVLGAAAALTVLGVLEPLLLLLVVVALPAVPVAVRQQRWLKEGEEQSAAPSRLAQHLRHVATDRDAGSELRVFGLGDEVRARARAAAHAARRPYLAAERRVAVTNAGRHAVFAIGYAVAITVMLWRAASGQASVGDVVAVAFIARQVADSIVAPIFSTAGLGVAIRSASRLLWLRDYADSEAARRTGRGHPPCRLADAIEFDNVSFTYPGTTRTVLSGVSVTIPAGTVVAVVGDNGAGKTTLVKLLARMYEPTAGRILVDGVDLAEIDIESWRSRQSAAFQDFAKLELVAQHAVGVGDLPRLDDESAVRAALARAAADDVLDALPDGLATRLGSSWPGGVDLSTGQWQKLALGRALMREAPLVLFFDEPTASLDAPTEHALFTRLAEAARRGSATGAVTVLVSHRFSTVRAADLILVLDGGRLVEVGSHEQLVAINGSYANMYALQANSFG